MGVKHPVPHKAIEHKTKHATGWHKRTEPTTNYPKDEHKAFCRRCLAYNFTCPVSGDKPSRFCDL